MEKKVNVTPVHKKKKKKELRGFSEKLQAYLQFNASKCKVMSITRKQRPEAIVNVALIAVCSLTVTKFAHWLMSRLRRRNKRYQNPEKAKTNGNCSKLLAASTIPTTRA